jgi:outer membrane protein assembly factor BamB
VADIPHFGPTVYLGSYDGNFYALDARSGKVKWQRKAGGRISGSATIVGNIVYFANLAARTTIGLAVRSGAPVFKFPHGGFNPVISDGHRLYLTGYSSLYGLIPKTAEQRAAARRRVREQHKRERLRRRQQRQRRHH